MLRSYPTLGPGGQEVLDVNGLAASIELYLGRDVLTQDDGSLTPVQWKGYNDVLRQYQGEVMRKTQLQQSFYLKVKSVRADASLMATTDWTGLIAIAKVIFTAFEDPS